MKNILYRTLHVVGKDGIIALCPNIVEEGSSLFEDKNIFKGVSSQNVPFVLVGTKFNEDYRSSEVLKAISDFVDALNIRVILKDTCVGGDSYQRMVLDDIKIDQFRCKMIGPETEKERKQLYKCLACINSVINIDGLLFFIIRKNGSLVFEPLETKDQERAYYASLGVDRPDLFFKGGQYTQHAVKLNQTKYESLENVVFEAWPSELTLVSMETYTGRMKAQAFADLEAPVNN